MLLTGIMQRIKIVATYCSFRREKKLNIFICGFQAVLVIVISSAWWWETLLSVVFRQTQRLKSPFNPVEEKRVWIIHPWCFYFLFFIIQCCINSRLCLQEAPEALPFSDKEGNIVMLMQSLHFTLWAVWAWICYAYLQLSLLPFTNVVWNITMPELFNRQLCLISCAIFSLQGYFEHQRIV